MVLKMLFLRRGVIFLLSSQNFWLFWPSWHTAWYMLRQDPVTRILVLLAAGKLSLLGAGAYPNSTLVSVNSPDPVQEPGCNE
jgi:hypothetical protein